MERFSAKSLRINSLNLITSSEFQYNIHFYFTLYAYQLTNHYQVWMKENGNNG